MSSTGNTPGREAALDLLRALARFADLPLSEAQLAALSDDFTTTVAEHSALRQTLAPEVEPDVVFDPRWE